MLAGLCLAATASAQASKTSGKPFDTRDPKSCDSTKQPLKGPLSADQARQYLICNLEGEGYGANMYLLEDVRVEVGKGTPYKELDKGARPSDGDFDGIVYRIRGSYKQYQCSKPSAIMNNKGKNCNLFDNPQATGTCYRTGFGDWKCNMHDLSATNHMKEHVAPPASK